MRFWLILAAFVLLGTPAQAGVTVYELFTARDCPSCPAADAIFAQLAQTKPDVIALACHVTYFDRPGRSDALSAEFCDGRQTGYKQSKVVDRLYTPAVVVNGMYGVQGNNREAVNTSLTASNVVETVKPVYLSVTDGYLNIQLPNVELSEAADVWVFGYDGRNAVTYLTKLMRWNGKAVAMAFPTEDAPAKGYAVIAQTASQTNILAAGKTN